MNRFVYTLLFAMLCLTCVSDSHAKTYAERINEKELEIQQTLRDFRFLREVEKFPERFNATLPLKVITTPLGSIATLHDINTGAPLETCLTPCVLHQEPNWRYRLVVYKKGYFPRRLTRKSGAHASGKTLHIDLGMDYYAVRRKQKKCKQDFKSTPKVDGDAKPCYRHPPVMPRNAKASGHCKMNFDVTETGRVNNIKVESCTEELFRKPSKTALTWWRYTPKVDRGMAVPRMGVETKISFRLTDKDGNLIPEF